MSTSETQLTPSILSAYQTHRSQLSRYACHLRNDSLSSGFLQLHPQYSSSGIGPLYIWLGLVFLARKSKFFQAYAFDGALALSEL